MATVAHKAEANAKPKTEADVKPKVICEVDISAASDATIEAALTYCRRRGAEVLFLWVLEPRIFSSPFPGSAGATGTWGLPWTLRRAVERAREQGVAASSIVRVGQRERVLEAERETAGAEAVFPAAHKIARCPLCHARYDPRAVHFCPTVHLPPRKPPAAATRSD